MTIFPALIGFGAGLFVAFISGSFAHWLKLAEFRQTWINDQRRDIAEYLGIAREWIDLWERQNDLKRADLGNRDQLIPMEHELFVIANRALIVLWRVEMRMNPLLNKRFDDDRALLESLRCLLRPPPLAFGQTPEGEWRKQANVAVAKSQLMLKAEWQVIKKTLIRLWWDEACRHWVCFVAALREALGKRSPTNEQ